ncbi:TAXI family TRAP transporter solute-binding subunit [Cellulosilyticum sp. I15G10I2]|uniref:TAXI family TRAP transporter solute-binding subunit n=1 Tax=Cellulosilyticum sp. I15G10I2 TaxID=1892843 RepID=UPI00085C5C8E|nr:TAXI family TRAP transporter solute-binding subunit [Cellulosilyticum sp. I15G10I2]
MKKILSVLLSLLLSSSVLTACGGANTNSGSTKSAEVVENSANATDNSEKSYTKPKFLTIGTAGTGGAYYPIGITMAQIINDNLGIDTTAQVTGGATENNSLIQEGTADLAITQASLAYAAVNGKDPYSNKLSSVQAIMTGLSKGIFHVVTLKSSGINSIADLKGKTVVLGPAGGAAITMANEVFAEYGFSINDVTASYVTYSDGMTALTDGTAHAVVVQSAAPASAILELAATNAKNMVILSPEKDKIDNILKNYPYYQAITIPADVYGTDSDIQTIYVSNMVVCSADLPTELVYDITKTFFENLDQLKESNPAAKALTLEGAAIGCPIDIHPGALMYYKEVGVIND